MEQLSTNEAKLVLLKGRIDYRAGWAKRNVPPGNAPFDRQDEIWAEMYDEENNFAHMGARYVDEEWGKPKVKKVTKKATPLSPEVMRLLTLMRAAKTN